MKPEMRIPSKFMFCGALALALQPSCGQSGDEGRATSPQPDRAEAVSPDPWGEVEAVVGEGTSELCRADCKPVSAGASLALGDALQTQATSRLALRLGDGARVQLDASTRLSLQDKGRLKLEQGEVVIETPGPLSVETPGGLVSARAGTARIAVTPERVQIGILAGDAEIEVAGERRILAAGESALIEARQIRILPGGNLAYQTAWARDIQVEAEQADGSEASPAGVGSIHGKDPATKVVLPEAILIPELKVKLTAREQIARTEIEQTFLNTTNRTLEGIYTFPLPHDASIVRFAMEINGEMMEGEVVERGRAVQIFDSIVADHIRPKDPALLEWKGGNTFQIRIFPIFPNARQKVLLWYTQALTRDGASSRYTYPLPRTGKVDVDRFTFEADIEAVNPLDAVRTPMYASSVDMAQGGRRATVRFEKEGFTPRQDLVLEWSAAQSTSSTVFEASDREPGQDPYFMMVVRPSLMAREGKLGTSGRSTGARDHLFCVDTSFGTSEGDLSAAAAAVAAWLATLGPDDRFAVASANQDFTLWRPDFQTVTNDNVQQAMAFLEGLQPAGASDIEGLFLKSAELLRGARSPVLVYVGDGRATIGETRHEPLIDRVDIALGGAAATIHTVGLGSDVNVPMLSVLARRFGGVSVVLNRGEDVPRRVEEVAFGARRPALRQATLTFSSDKIERIYPTHIPTLFAGDEIVVVGRYKGVVDGQVTLTGLVGDEPFAEPFRVRLDSQQAQPRSFVPRLWAQQHIEHLTLYGGPASHQEIIDTSVRHTVMSRLTTFLVLESERMFANFKINRDRDRQYWEAPQGAQPPAEEEKSDYKNEEAEAAASEDEGGSLEASAAKALPNAPSREPMPEADNNFRRGAEVVDDGLARAEAEDREGESQKETAEKDMKARDRGPMPDPKVGGKTSGNKLDDAQTSPLAPAQTRRNQNLGASWGGDGDDDAIASQDPPPLSKPSPREDRAKAGEAPRAAARPKKPNLDFAPNDAGGADNIFGGAPAKGRSGGGGSVDKGEGMAGRGIHERIYIPPPPASITSLSPQPPSGPDAQIDALRASVAAAPLLRDPRRRLVEALLRRGDAVEARAALEDWLKVDPEYAVIHWRLADLMGRTGVETSAIERHFGNAIEVAPSDPAALKRWALHLLLRGEHTLAASVWRALSALTGGLDDALDLVAVESLVDASGARDHLARMRATHAAAMSPAQLARADALAQVLSSGRGDPLEGMPGAERAFRGAAVVEMGWEGAQDLDLSVLLPHGERISPDMPMSLRGDGKRGHVAAQAAAGHPAGAGARAPLEAIVMAWAPQGHYIVEVTRRGDAAASASGWVRIKVLGVARTFQFTIPAGDRDVRIAAFRVNPPSHVYKRPSRGDFREFEPFR